MFSCQIGGPALIGVWPVNTEKAACSNVAFTFDILPLKQQKSPKYTCVALYTLLNAAHGDSGTICELKLTHTQHTQTAVGTFWHFDINQWGETRKINSEENSAWLK